jgi:hypothetical protein
MDRRFESRLDEGTETVRGPVSFPKFCEIPCSKLGIENGPTALRGRRQQNAHVGANKPADVRCLERCPVEKDYLGSGRRKGRA